MAGNSLPYTRSAIPHATHSMDSPTACESARPNAPHATCFAPSALTICTVALLLFNV
jgi:hypothetical protein